MRTTVDIPDPLYRELKSRAAVTSSTVKELILRAVHVSLRSPQERNIPGKGLVLPKTRSQRPGSLKLGEEGVYDYISFP